MLIQIHMLQNYAPSNLNRDDSGSPKSSVFGGHPRGRISSQCLKRSIRRSLTFDEAFADRGLLAARTRRLPLLIDDALRAMGVDDETRRASTARAPEIGQESTKREKATADPEQVETRQLIFIGSDEAKQIAEKLLARYQEAGPKSWPDLKIEEITKGLGDELPRSVDIAMFGRMTTSAAFEDVAAAVQVAHALSTNRIVNEYDFFTAVDDLKPREEDAGAGMIGDVEFNSSTYYKYFNIHWEQLVENLGGDAEVATQAVAALVEAAALAQPSGKQNSFAAQNLPDFVLVEVNDRNIPVSYSNAFITPVDAFGRSLMNKSAAALSQYARRLRDAYGLEGERAYFAVDEVEGIDAEDVGNLAALKAWTVAQIERRNHG